MLRKTLTILSLIGLLLSVGLWGASYWGLGYFFCEEQDSCWGVYQVEGNLTYLADAGRVPRGLYYQGFRGLTTWWVPRMTVAGKQITVHRFWWIRGGRLQWCGISLWMPAVLCAILPCYNLLPFHRRRKRKKLGLCVKCGYDLRGSEDRCPECGTAFEK